MHRHLLPVLGLILLCSCATPSGSLAPVSSLPPGVAREGTLANAALVRDTTAALRRATGGSRPIIKFVIQQPVGAVGRKAWREVWVYDPEGQQQKFIITFKEDGRGSADFGIQRMPR